MDTDIIIFVVELILSLAMIMVGCILYFRNPANSRLRKMEKKVTGYLTHEGYHWEKLEGVLTVRRSGMHFRIFLDDPKEVRSTLLMIQYATTDENLSNMHWVGQNTMVNTLANKHPVLNAGVTTENNMLWVHYRADIRSRKEFAFHFNVAYNEIRLFLNDCCELLPKLQSDFPAQAKVQKPIGFV